MKRSKIKTDSTQELVDMICRACLVAKDAAFNVGDYIASSSRIAFVVRTRGHNIWLQLFHMCVWK